MRFEGRNNSWAFNDQWGLLHFWTLTKIRIPEPFKPWKRPFSDLSIDKNRSDTQVKKKRKQFTFIKKCIPQPIRFLFRFNLYQMCTYFLTSQLFCMKKNHLKRCKGNALFVWGHYHNRTIIFKWGSLNLWYRTIKKGNALSVWRHYHNPALVLPQITHFFLSSTT